MRRVVGPGRDTTEHGARFLRFFVELGQQQLADRHRLLRVCYRLASRIRVTNWSMYSWTPRRTASPCWVDAPPVMPPLWRSDTCTSAGVAWYESFAVV